VKQNKFIKKIVHFNLVPKLLTMNPIISKFLIHKAANVCLLPKVWSSTSGNVSVQCIKSRKMSSFLLEGSKENESEVSCYNQYVTSNAWSNSISFASPESDFSSSNNKVTETIMKEDIKGDFINQTEQNSFLRDTMIYSLSFSSTENDFSNNSITNILNDIQKRQLDQVSENMQASKSQRNNTGQIGKEYESSKSFMYHIQEDDISLPKTLKEALRPNEKRSVVITESNFPHRIISVNKAWEDLCGYASSECQGGTLSCIQGPETNHDDIKILMSNLIRGEETEIILTNYTKGGRKFRNQLKAGVLKNEHDIVTNFVGVLTETEAKEFDTLRSVHA